MQSLAWRCSTEQVASDSERKAHAAGGPRGRHARKEWTAKARIRSRVA
jgi:hypothetical protein